MQYQIIILWIKKINLIKYWDKNQTNSIKLTKNYKFQIKNNQNKI